MYVQISRFKRHCGKDVTRVRFFQDFMYFSMSPSMVATETAAQSSIGIQTCSGHFSTVFEHFWGNKKFHQKQFFHTKIKNHQISVKKPSFFKFYTFRDAHSHNKLHSERCIAHAITCTYVLVEVYQGFRVSRCCVDIRSNISHPSHSKNHTFILSK